GDRTAVEALSARLFRYQATGSSGQSRVVPPWERRRPKRRLLVPGCARGLRCSRVEPSTGWGAAACGARSPRSGGSARGSGPCDGRFPRGCAARRRPVQSAAERTRWRTVVQDIFDGCTSYDKSGKALANDWPRGLLLIGGFLTLG